MRKLIALLFMASFIQGCGQKAQDGRFQIVAGTYDEIVNNAGSTIGSSSQQHGVFKIDTQTGRTWVYLDATGLMTNGASITEGWREIKDVSTSFQKSN